MDFKYVNLSEGARVFEHDGMCLYSYNAKLKVAGDSVKVSFFQNGILSGWTKNSRKENDDKKEYTYDPEKRWFQTGLKAKRAVYDTIAANIHMHRDHNGKKQSFKMFTMTFREDVKLYKEANSMFNDFIGRLNYFFTGAKGETFLKYLAVPELQMETDRYVWHYHVIFFNLPYVPVSGKIVDDLIAEGRLKSDYDKRDTLFYIWGQGGVKINKLKDDEDSYNAAGYISKYVNKGLDGLYEYASEMGNLNRRRYLKSTGLVNPRVIIAFLNKEQRQAISNYFKQHCKKFKRRGELGKYFETFSVDNEFIGRMFGINFRASKKRIEKLTDMFEEFSYGFC